MAQSELSRPAIRDLGTVVGDGDTLSKPSRRLARAPERPLRDHAPPPHGRSCLSGPGREKREPAASKFDVALSKSSQWTSARLNERPLVLHNMGHTTTKIVVATLGRGTWISRRLYDLCHMRAWCRTPRWLEVRGRCCPDTTCAREPAAHVAWAVGGTATAATPGRPATASDRE